MDGVERAGGVAVSVRGRLDLWPLRSKLGFASSNGRTTDNTYDREVRRLWIGDRHKVKNLHDSKRENKLITGHRILIDIHKGEYEVRGKVYCKPLKKG